VLCDNPTAIVQPGIEPDPGYILAESNGGLGNRLRVLAAYMWIAHANFNDSHLAFIWDINDACPGHFLEVFKPIPRVIFAKNESRYVLDKHAKIVYENSLAVFSWTMLMNKIPKNRFGFPSWTQIETQMYMKFNPTKVLMQKIKRYVQIHNICQASAMHIRLTDLNAVMPAKKRISVSNFYSFVEEQPSVVFLITDDPFAQSHLIEKYGKEKIIVYRNITGTSRPDYIKDTDAFRFTTLEHTVIDVFIAAHAKVFKPSGYSSLSDLVFKMSSIGKTHYGWCALN
jgi:hypothetical protein